MDFELMEPLCYEDFDDDDDDNLKTGRKRSGTVNVDDNSRCTKRQRRVGQGESGDDRNENIENVPVGGSSRETAELKETESAFISDIIPTASGSILQDSARSNLSTGRNIEPITGGEEDTDLTTVRYRRVLKRIPTEIPYVPVTCEDGSRLYLRLKPVKTNEDEAAEAKCLMSRKSKMNLFNDWDRIKSEARVLKDKFHNELGKTVAVRPNEDKSEIKELSSSDSDILWVEKYKPRSFLDLLSQEAVNKALLHWVKLWDKSVFGTDYLAKVKATREKYAKLEAQDKEKEDKFQFQKKYQPPNEEYDEGGRPCVKVALLSGDPGLGKTTCAHIIARHAGYKVREVNASDDRSIEIFRKVIDDTTQSRSEIFQEGRPNCLIIDEIDGAPLASVNVLVELITGNATESGKKKAKKVLRRPIICICNDLYAPPLKLLKKHSFLLQFPSISVPRLIERLNNVSARESLFLDSNTLQSLCQKSDCDIRSCLSTLQFLKRKRCTPKDALFTQIGMKDKAKGIFAVWSDIFTLPEEKRYHDMHDPGKPDIRFRKVLQSVQGFGEYEKLHGGVFENYLNVKYKDSYFESIIDSLEWGTWFEEIRHFVNRTQDYGVFGYLPMYFVMSHFLFARRDSLKIKFPNAELASKLPKFQHTIRNQISEAPIPVARFLDPYMLVTDVYPAVLNIIQPCNIRPVPSQIWTQRERDTLRNVVEVMLAFNVCYTQSKNPETGSYSFVLEPDLEELVTFKLQDSGSSRKPFPYAIKQLVAREIETEKLRRNDMIPDVVQRESFKLPETPKPTAAKSKVFESVNKTPEAIPRDFFGRPLQKCPETSLDADAKQKESVKVHFRYKEGFSNAVRRYIKMRDLN